MMRFTSRFHPDSPRLTASAVWAVLLVSLLLPLPLMAQGASSPADAFRRFASALNSGRQEEAWNLLSESTRFELSNAARRAAKAEGRPPPKDGRQLAFGSGLALQRQIKSIKVAEGSDERARLEVEDDTGEIQSVMVVKENGQWYVDFSEELRGLRQN